jgi:hypothetical protein
MARILERDHGPDVELSGLCDDFVGGLLGTNIEDSGEEGIIS